MGPVRSWGGAGRRCVVVVAVAVVSALTACGGPRPDPRVDRHPDPGHATVSEDSSVIAMGLAAPWSITFYRSTPLVSERERGQIIEVDADGRMRRVGTVEGVDSTAEGGLLGIVVRERHLYAYYTAGPQNRIVRFPIRGAAGSLSLGPPETVFDGIPAAAQHDGGRIAFGPDGMLYATTGDAGRPQLAQDLGSLAGKILRLTPTGEIPADNPFPGSPVYTLGHHNPQGIAWAPDHRMFASDLGADRADELNLIEPGQNYGWPVVEGAGHRAGYRDPLRTWLPDEASPSGIAVVGGAVLVANLRGERICTVPLGDPGAVTDHHTGEFGRLRDIVVAPGGAVWVLTNNTDGRGTPGAGDDRIIRVGLGSGAR